MLNAGLFLLLLAFVVRVVVWLRLCCIFGVQVSTGDRLVDSGFSEAFAWFATVIADSSPFGAKRSPVFLKSLGFPSMFLRTAASCESVRCPQRFSSNHRRVSG